MNENEAMKDLIKHRQGSAREVERLKSVTFEETINVE